MERYFIFRELPPEEIEMISRERIANFLKQRPMVLTKYLLSRVLNRFLNLFEKGTFGIISPCRPDQKRGDQFKAMYDFAEKLRGKGLYSIVHNGYWGFLDTRCFFIPGVDRDNLESMADEIHQDFYIWGEKRRWCCYKVGTEKELDKGSSFRVLEIDEEFFFYQKARKAKENLVKLKTEVIKHKSKRTAKRILPAIERKITDYKQMEKAIIGGTLWK